jgi:acetyl-CoA carboxylase biotin carboxyl carrier protein
LATKIVMETAGSVWKVLVQEGVEVEDGQQLFIMEVMKMEVPYEAPVGGKITALNITEGDFVEEGHIALVID